MRNPQRISETLDLIEAIWRKYPDFRLGQLIQNVLLADDPDMYNIEDDVLYQRLCEEYPL